jgi:NDP-sugar pyrophosphorylase family protein
MKAMVLAAGVGSRLEPLTNQVPKPMVPIANRPVMQHIVALLKQHGITEIASNLHYLPDQITQYFNDGSKFGVHWRGHLEKELSGDAGGVRSCKEFLSDGTFIVLMGDLLTDCDLSAVIARHKEKGALASIAIKQVEDVSHFGVVVTNPDGFIVGFQEKPKPEEALSNYASTGIYVLEPEVFKHIPATGTYGFGRQLFPTLVQNGLPVLGVPIDQYYWSDVGTINQYRLSNFDALAGRVKIALPGLKKPFGYAEESAVIDADARIEGKLLIGKNSKIGKGVRIKGHVLIGDNCRIDPNAELEDTIVWADSVVGREAILRNCVVGSHCTVGDGTKQNEIASVPLSPQLL